MLIEATVVFILSLVLVGYFVAYVVIRLRLAYLRRAVLQRQGELIDCQCDTAGYAQLLTFSTRLCGEFQQKAEVRNA
jgi:hypothetical protein